MKPWHRDAIAVMGVGSLLTSAFLVSVVAGLLVLGIALLQFAFMSVPEEEETRDGS